MADDDIVGPLFISIGDQEKLNAFLEQNPKVPRNQMFVDDYSFDAYKIAGFGRFDEQDKELANAAMKNMGAPDLGFKGWLSYLSSAAKVSPIPKDMKFGEVPEGVLRLGGTFVVKGNDVLYRWSDRLPGDHPDIQKVVGIAKDAQAEKSGVGSIFANLFNA
jgi:hypothetical protein